VAFTGELVPNGGPYVNCPDTWHVAPSTERAGQDWEREANAFRNIAAALSQKLDKEGFKHQWDRAGNVTFTEASGQEGRREELRAGMTEEAHTRVKRTIDTLCECSDGWKKRAERSEAELARVRELVNKAPEYVEMGTLSTVKWLEELREALGISERGAEK
jgi:hypothetical protein